MKAMLKNAITKKILIVFITIIMLSNFIMPNYVHAGGNPLIIGFFHLLSYGGDVVISLLQRVMIGDDDIQTGSAYQIKYSPGMIFSNEVAGLKVNFITAEENDKKIVYLTTEPDNVTELKEVITRMNTALKEGRVTRERVGDIVKKSGTEELEIKSYIEGDFEEETGVKLGKMSDGTQFYEFRDHREQTSCATPWEWGGHAGFKEDDVDPILPKKLNFLLWCYNGYLYYAVFDWAYDTGSYNSDLGRYRYIAVETCVIDRFNLDAITSDKVVVESVASQLQSNISSWYNGLRTIALVGLLSVLVYIGIRIIMNSGSAENKAKYKNMLKDWLVAICLLFVLHYVMALMLEVTESLNEIIKSNVISRTANGNNYDVLMSTIRGRAQTSASEKPEWDVATNTVMYLALVMLTVTFTIQYLKRVVYMAFLSMIAPMVALTYPLDKVKDGKAQAFKYWLREYIFNCLIQPVHLLIYTVLISNAIEFAKDNVLYAIVALAFMVPAEKFIKSMFGMNSESPVSTIGAAAGGALAMSMMNKMQKTKGPKEGKEKASSSNIRMANNGATGGNGTGINLTGGTGNNSLGGANPSVTPTAKKGKSESSGASPAKNSSPSATKNKNTPNYTQAPRQYSKARGINAVAKRYIYGPDAIKSHLGKLTRATAGALTGIAAGTVAIAANIADGDLIDNPGKAGKEIGATGLVGYHAGSNLTGRALKRENKKNSAKSTKNMSQIERINIYQDYYDIGVTDKKIIENAIKNDITPELYSKYYELGITKVEDMTAFIKNDIKIDEYKQYTSMGIIGMNNVIELSEKNIKPEEYKKYTEVGIKSIDEVILLTNEKIDVNKYKEYSSEGIETTKDIIALNKQGITKEAYKKYKEMGAVSVRDVITLKQKGITKDVCAEYNSVGIKMINDIVLLKSKGITKDKYAEYLKNGVKSARDVTTLHVAHISADKYSEYKNIGVDRVQDIIGFNNNKIDVEKLKAIKEKTGEKNTRKLIKYNKLAKEAKQAKISSNSSTKFIKWMKERGSKEEEAKEMYEKAKYFM